MVETVKSEQSRANTRADPYNNNGTPIEIPESRATMNNFVSKKFFTFKSLMLYFKVNRIPSAAVRERFQQIAETLNDKWKVINHELQSKYDVFCLNNVCSNICI